ncbi:CbiX/SirB N-terminal domain-containing protein [Streptomyces sp. NBC_00879]|uniref:sirohydrochlorin chelatase n=1 Tax=unclassified Streptomyces TaxID=2593676 RepID=UPI0033F69021|nr:CbiX/SirB N-terminal domain-containing protein [Streptomyces sp. NBC_00885]WSY78522.1 CbiX/SirB N-terminal domain-containing protein [Streptomyces sp. NBC_00879]
MSSPTGPASGLPVRMPRPRQSGRHRRPEPVAAPEGAPALVLAVPGAPAPATRSLAEEVISIARSELPGLDVGIGYLDGDDAEYPTLETVLAQNAARRTERYEIAKAAGREVAAPEGPAAVVVPLLAGPDNALMRRIRQAVMDSRSAAELTDVLGPHPLLAEALHVRLSEAGLARADRARLFTVATAADGIILATVGGEEAVQAAGITGMLLAARLAVPVMAAALDHEGAVGAIAEQLRGSGSVQLALAPYLVGPELPEGLLDAAAKEAGCAAAEALGAYPAIGKLVLAQYTTALGITPPQGSPSR